MPVYLRHGNVWLRIKEVYTIQSVRSKRRGRQQRRSTPYGMVAVSLEEVPLDGLVEAGEVKVPATKVSRFTAKAHLALPQSVTLLILPDGEDYVAKVYVRSKSDAQKALDIVSRILAELHTRHGEEEEAEEEAEEVGEEE